MCKIPDVQLLLVSVFIEQSMSFNLVPTPNDVTALTLGYMMLVLLLSHLAHSHQPPPSMPQFPIHKTGMNETSDSEPQWRTYESLRISRKPEVLSRKRPHMGRSISQFPEAIPWD